MSASPFRIRPEGLLVALRLTPRASRNAVTGIDRTASGESYLKITVTAVPEDGKANIALCKFLARLWQLPAGQLRLASGAASRHKQLLIAGGDAALKVRLEDWLSRFAERL